MGSDLRRFPPGQWLAGFNSRSRMGSDGPPPRGEGDVLRFNSRSRMGSDDVVRRFLPRPRRFNSRSRMGSDQSAARRFVPQWCFNSRSRMGSDQICVETAPHWRSFNSRSRMGSDSGWRAVALIAPVSIRAPAWGATMSEMSSAYSWPFQFALPHGERRWFRAPPTASGEFQFALPHGERPIPAFEPFG